MFSVVVDTPSPSFAKIGAPNCIFIFALCSFFNFLAIVSVPERATGIIGILFFTVLFQRLKAAKTDKYRDVQI